MFCPRSFTPTVCQPSRFGVTKSLARLSPTYTQGRPSETRFKILIVSYVRLRRAELFGDHDFVEQVFQAECSDLVPLRHRPAIRQQAQGVICLLELLEESNHSCVDAQIGSVIPIYIDEFSLVMRKLKVSQNVPNRIHTSQFEQRPKPIEDSGSTLYVRHTAKWPEIQNARSRARDTACRRGQTRRRTLQAAAPRTTT